MFFPLWLMGRGHVVTVPPSAPFLLQEDGFFLLQEDLGKIIIESASAPNDFLLQEDGFLILQQNGYNIII